MGQDVAHDGEITFTAKCISSPSLLIAFTLPRIEPALFTSTSSLSKRWFSWRARASMLEIDETSPCAHGYSTLVFQPPP